VERPPPLLFEQGHELPRLCAALGRADLRGYLGLVGESMRVQALQRLAWAKLLLTEQPPLPPPPTAAGGGGGTLECTACDAAALVYDVVRAVGTVLPPQPRGRRSQLNLRVLGEEACGPLPLSRENLARLHTVQQQLLPRGVASICRMLDAAGLGGSLAQPHLLAQVEQAAAAQHSAAGHTGDPATSGWYRCTVASGVARRVAPAEQVEKGPGPQLGDLVAVETVVRATLPSSELDSPSLQIQADIDAALAQLGASLGLDVVQDLRANMERESLPPAQQLAQLLSFGIPVQLPSQQSNHRAMCEVQYLRLFDGGYCPLQPPRGGPAATPYFERVRDLTVPPGNNPMESVAVAVLAARTCAQQPGTCEGVLPFEWRRFQRFAAVWPAHPQTLGTPLPSALGQDDPLGAFLTSLSLSYLVPTLRARGLTIGDLPFLSEAELSDDIHKPYHRKRLLRHAREDLPIKPAAPASEAERATLVPCRVDGCEAQSTLWVPPGKRGRADALFHDHIVHFRRIRQLVDISEQAERDRRMRGKFCGQFCPGGDGPEKASVRSRIMQEELHGDLDVRTAIERMWEGELELQVLAEGCSTQGCRLMELILNACDIDLRALCVHASIVWRSCRLIVWTFWLQGGRRV
jgi:hypothetical protein